MSENGRFLPSSIKMNNMIVVIYLEYCVRNSCQWPIAGKVGYPEYVDSPFVYFGQSLRRGEKDKHAKLVEDYYSNLYKCLRILCGVRVSEIIFRMSTHDYLYVRKNAHG